MGLIWDWFGDSNSLLVLERVEHDDDDDDDDNDND